MITYPSELLTYRDDREVWMLRADLTNSLYRTVQRWHVDESVRIVRGDRMKTWDSLYDEMSAAFQFPLYFGRNLDALIESLSEPDQEPIRSPRLCIIAEAQLVLSDENQVELDRFIHCLQHVRRNWKARPPQHVEGVDPVFSTLIVPSVNSETVFTKWAAARSTIAQLWVND